MTPSTPESSAPAADRYVGVFERWAKGHGDPAWVAARRRAGMARFVELGLPTLEQEDWRFTNLAPLLKLPFHPVLQPCGLELEAATLQGLPFAKVPGPRLVFVNGHFASRLSSPDPLPEGVRVGNLAAALAGGGDGLEAHLGRYAGVAGDGFGALNDAFFLDGALIEVPPGMTLDEPIQLVWVATGARSGTTVHPRNLVLVGAGSSVTILETYAAAGGERNVTNAVTELAVGEEARVEWVKLQDEATSAGHLSAFHGEFGRASRAAVHSVSLGARLARNNLRARLVGEDLECVLNGLYITAGEQLADHHMLVEHQQPRGTSHEYFHGILDGKSRGVFHGRILVQPAAQKTDAKQTNRNLLLSDLATANSMPQLEIYADDVKCTHGATVGQLNPEAIFYLRSRGLGPQMARRMLIHAFAGEIIERIASQPAREALSRLVWDRLEANSHLAG